jgi:hypothetical protein
LQKRIAAVIASVLVALKCSSTHDPANVASSDRGDSIQKVLKQRVCLMTLALVAASTGCGGDDGDESSTSSFSTAPPTSASDPGSWAAYPDGSTTTPPTSASTPGPLTLACAVNAYSEGRFDVDTECAVERALDQLSAQTALQESIAVQLGWGPGNGSLVSEWIDYVCESGGPAVGQLLNSVDPQRQQRIFLLSPMTDFAAAVQHSCGDRVAAEVSAFVWKDALGPAPTVADVESLFGQQQQMPQVARDLFENAHNPCDVVGNGAALLVQHLTQTDTPDWVDFAVGFAIGELCEGRFG